MNHEELLKKYRSTVQSLIDVGAKSNEAEILAAQIVGRPSDESSEEAELYRRLKSEGLPYAYFYGSFIIERLAASSVADVGLQMVVRIPVGHRPAKFEFEGYQAVRLLTLLKSKFDDFEKDVRQGFLHSELDMSDQDIITKNKLSLNYENITDSRELHRAIRDKFSQKLNNNQVIERLNPEGANALVRLGFSPSRVIFQSAKVFDQFETLTNKSFLRFSEQYSIRLPY